MIQSHLQHDTTPREAYLLRKQRLTQFKVRFRQALWRVIKQQQRLLSPSLIIYEEDSMDDQGSVEDGSSSEGGGADEHKSSGGGQEAPLMMPSVEDINLNYAQYQEVIKELGIKTEEFTQVSLDKMYQILTCN